MDIDEVTKARADKLSFESLVKRLQDASYCGSIPISQEVRSAQYALYSAHLAIEKLLTLLGE